MRDSKTAKQVLTWIIKYWPQEPKYKCPYGFGEFLALIDYESRDKSTKTNGKPYTYFNAIGGPYASRAKGKLIGTTAVGLAQFTKATASRAVAYDGEKSIEAAIQLLFKDASNNGGNFDPKKQRAFNRWEAWRTQRSSIEGKGKKINELIKKNNGINKITNAQLNAILGIQ